MLGYCVCALAEAAAIATARAHAQDPTRLQVICPFSWLSDLRIAQCGLKAGT